MICSRPWRALACVALLVAQFVLPSEVHAQSTGVSSKSLLRSNVSGDDSKESIILAIEFLPGATTGRHTHPGDEFATVVDGILELRIEGQEPRRVSAGQSYHNAKGVVHETRNVGEGVAKAIATFIVEKGKPRTQPAQ